MKLAALVTSLSLLALGCTEREAAKPAPKEAARQASAASLEPSADARVPFTLLATGDNRGEFAPCGCEPPAGGLARRVAAVRSLRSAGPALVVDAGDALFFGRRHADPEQARLILEGMRATGVVAAAVGEGDLALGLPWLQEEAARAEVPYLSANLRDASGAAPFPGRRLVEVGGNRVGFFSVLTSARRLPEGLTLADPLEAATAEIAALREEGAELVVGLVHGPKREMNRLAQKVDVDLVIPAHQGGNTWPYPRGEAWVAYTGYQGRNLLEVSVDLRGEGTLVNADALDEIAARREELEKKLAIGEKQLASVRLPAQRAEIEGLMSDFSRELERLAREVELIGEDRGRNFRTRFINLDGALGEEPSFAEKIAKLEGR